LGKFAFADAGILPPLQTNNYFLQGRLIDAFALMAVALFGSLKKPSKQPRCGGWSEMALPAIAF